MSSKNRNRLALLALAFAACGEPELPDGQKIKEDLLGKSVAAPDAVWIFDSLRQFESLKVVEIVESGDVAEFLVELLLARDGELFEAKGSVSYVNEERQWKYRAASLAELYSRNAKAQLETVKAVRQLATGYLSYLADHTEQLEGARRRERIQFEVLEAQLKPDRGFEYLTEVPRIDGWGNEVEVWLLPSTWPKYQVVVRSSGSDGVFESGALYGRGAFNQSNHEKDIVWADGYFLDYPGP